MKVFWFGVFFFILAVPAAAADERTDAVQAWVEANLPGMMREARMPGFAIAVVRDGETIYAEAFGARDSAKNLPATTDTLFGIGSITKSFVAISILQLAEQGKLSLDDPVSKYLPFTLGRPDEPILIRHFLTHSPGFPNLGTSTVLLSRGLGRDTGVPMSSAADFFRFINGARDEILFSPGEHFFYNNAAWRMLGAIVQQVSGMPFHQYVTENVIRPLGMERSTFDIDQLYADADHLTPYLKKDDGVEAAKFPYPNPTHNPDFSFLTAAGGIASSVTEMTGYLNMLIAQGGYPGGQLVSPRSMRAMQQRHIRRPDGDYGLRGYGFGLNVTPDFLGHKLVDHGGSIVVSTAYMSFVPNAKIGVVMMGNSGGIRYSPIAEAVLAILMGENPETAVPALGIRRRMQQLVGSYAVYRGLQKVDVINDGGLLYLKQADSASQVPLIPEDPSYKTLDFYTLRGGQKSPVNFRLDDQGEMSVLIGRYVFRKQR